MKKNKMMRLASCLLVAVLLTTCAVSGTFAKYVTSGSATDSARVAKWGVKIESTGSTFAKEYATDDEAVKGTIAKSVVSATEDKVVAPGTSGNMAAVSITGKPEVAVKVSYEPTTEGGKIFSIGSNWKYNDGTSDSYYCPIKITVGSETISGLDKNSATEFETAVNDAIKAYSKNYAANTDLSTVENVAPTISWAWDFEGAAGSAQTDLKDTYLGNLAADGDTNNDPTIELNLKVTVTQID